MYSVPMMCKTISDYKHVILLLVVLMLIVTFATLGSNPFFKPDSLYAIDSEVSCFIDYEWIHPLDQRIVEHVVAIRKDLRIGFFPALESFNSPKCVYNRLENTSIVLIIPECETINMFLFSDGEIDAYVRPWGSHSNYPVKNPKVLLPLVGEITSSQNLE